MLKQIRNRMLRSLLSKDDIALLRTRQTYVEQGRSRQWVDQRVRCTSARKDLADEWSRRGVSDGEQYRTLTNELVSATFGMDVDGFRQHKGLPDTKANLRDQMNDLELALVSLAETTA